MDEEFWLSSTKVPENIQNREGKDAPEACTARFDFKSFVYRGRRPFHPGRLINNILEPYFMDPALCLDEEPEDEEKRKSLRKSKNRSVYFLLFIVVTVGCKNNKRLGWNVLLRGLSLTWFHVTNLNCKRCFSDGGQRWVDDTSPAHRLAQQSYEFKRQFSSFYDEEDENFEPIFCTAAFLDPTFNVCVDKKYEPKIKEYLKGEKLLMLKLNEWLYFKIIDIVQNRHSKFMKFQIN